MKKITKLLVGGFVAISIAVAFIVMMGLRAFKKR
jgi:hypothetical protein